MPISFNCPCGKALRVADEHAGRRVKCPACQAVGTVPAPEPQFEVVEETSAPLVSPPPAPKPRPVAKPAPSRDDEEEEDGRGYSVDTKRDDEDEAPREKKKPEFRKGSGRTDDEDDEDEDEDRPKKKKKKRRSSSGYSGRPDPDAGKKVMYVVGGLLLVAIGIALVIFGWQAEGRGATRALIFGICLAVSGFGTMTQGATGNFDDDDE